MQAAVCAGILTVVLLAFLLLAPFLGLAGADITEGTVLAMGVFVFVGVRLFALSVQVRYIVRHGAENALAACLSAVVTAAIVCGIAGFGGLPDMGVAVLGVIVEITMVALLIRPASSRSW